MSHSLKARARQQLEKIPVVGPYFVDAVRERLHRKRTLSGHFSSPIPNIEEVHARAETIFNHARQEIPGIDLREHAQCELLRQFQAYQHEQPWSEEPQTGLRYSFRNRFFTQGDALMLYSMLRHFRPRRVIEVGSGFSSFVMLDTNDRFLDGQLELTFIEPFDERLRSRLTPTDEKQVRILNQFVQDVPLTLFDRLQRNDILFIDSSHVSKIGSDVNHLIFQVLPRLAPGVLIHVHDILYPFEYLREWFDERHYWNEAYLLRAFLQFNPSFEILAWNHYLGLHEQDTLATTIPLAPKDPGGSLWLHRK